MLTKRKSSTGITSRKGVRPLIKTVTKRPAQLMRAQRGKYTNRRSTGSGAAIVSLIVVCAGIAVTYAITNASSTQSTRAFEQQQQQQSNDVAAYVSTKITGYQQILLATAGLMNIKGSSQVTRDDWRNFVNNLNVKESHPEVLGIGYADVFTREELPAHIAQMQSQGFPDYIITPSGDRDIYTEVLYIEPYEGLNRNAIGYDMFTEPIRQKAMSSARDNSQIIMSGSLVLRQDNVAPGADTPRGVILYYPIYRSGIDPGTVDQRREQVVGYTYLGLRLEDMLQSEQSKLPDNVHSLTIIDNTTEPAVPLYSYSALTKHDNADTKTYEQNVSFLSRRWTIGITMEPSSIGKLINPLIIFLLGVLTSVLTGAVIYFVLNRRFKRLHQSHAREMQSARDELLALTSHQLRTPASSVKQYIGMLTHGYFGALTNEQQTIASKAYASNERQLEVIDQILYVAKADAGQLLLSPERIDVREITDNVLEDFSDAAGAKNITITAKGIKRLACRADSRYVRMIVENLISNAIKYSYPGTPVTVRYARTHDQIQVIVSDRGVGIENANIGRLFQKFSRIENPLSRAEGGSGLGLFLAGRLASAHGGSVTYQPTKIGGSLFVLTLPVNGPPENASPLTLTSKKFAR